MTTVKIKVLPGGKMPVKKTAGAAAWDCYARVCDGMQDVWVFLDEEKNKYCKNNNIPLLRIGYTRSKNKIEKFVYNFLVEIGGI